MSSTNVSSPTVQVSTPTSSTHIASPRLLMAARIGWVVIAAVALLVFLSNFAKLIEITQTVCASETCDNPFYLTPTLVNAFEQVSISPALWTIHIAVLEFLMMLAYTVTGAVIFVRRSDDWIAMLCSLMLLTIGTNTGLSATASGLIPGVVAMSASLITTMALSLAYTFMYVFPDGRFVPRRALWLLIPSIGWEVLRRTANIQIIDPDIPFRIEIFLVSLGWLAVGVIAQYYRYRFVSTPVQRQQTKWVMIAGAVAVVGVIVGASLYFVLLPRITVLPLTFNILFRLIYYAALFVLPVGIAFSVLRYRLWEVDLVINRSLVYGTLTTVLGAVFFLGIFGFNALLERILGGEQSTLAAILSTLIVVTAFTPSRKRLQHFVDRRFYHLRVDLDQLQKQQQARAEHRVAPLKGGTLSGATIGGYQIEGLIGKGGIGEVYLTAPSDTNGKRAALKILRPEFAESPEFRARFEREAKLVARLEHSNIVRVYDFGATQDRDELIHYMAMEYIEGQDLSSYLQLSGAMSIEQVRPIMRDIGAALDYAHTQGLVHRDVKPGNVMLRDGRAVLMDFGIAKIADSALSLTKSGMLGTIDYVAPEQILDSTKVDGRADVYSLGVMLYQMMTGALPFTGGVGQVVFAHLQQPPPDPRDLNPTMPHQAAHAILIALQKNPEDRYVKAGDLAKALG